MSILVVNLIQDSVNIALNYYCIQIILLFTYGGWQIQKENELNNEKVKIIYLVWGETYRSFKGFIRIATWLYK